jgi:hypothetical protein
MKEEFRNIKGYEGYYQVSNIGRIKSLERKGRSKDKILNIYINSNGYSFVRLSKFNKASNKTIHVMVARAFIPNPESYKTVNHKDLDKTNNHFNNLEWCSYKQNTRHYLDKPTTNIDKFVHSVCRSGPKPVKCTKTGKEYISIAAGARALGYHPQYIRDCLAGRVRNCTTLKLINKTKNETNSI